MMIELLFKCALKPHNFLLGKFIASNIELTMVFAVMRMSNRSIR